MLFIFSTPLLTIHLWKLKTMVFLHWYLICVMCCSIKVMSHYVKFLSLLNQLEVCSDHFTSCLFRPLGINKDPTINNISSTNLNI